MISYLVCIKIRNNSIVKREKFWQNGNDKGPVGVMDFGFVGGGGLGG